MNSCRSVGVDTRPEDCSVEILDTARLLHGSGVLTETGERPHAAREDVRAWERGGESTGGAPQKGGWARLKETLAVPSNVLVFTQGIPGSLPWGFLMVFLNDYLAQVTRRRGGRRGLNAPF